MCQVLKAADVAEFAQWQAAACRAVSSRCETDQSTTSGGEKHYGIASAESDKHHAHTCSFARAS